MTPKRMVGRNPGNYERGLAFMLGHRTQSVVLRSAGYWLIQDADAVRIRRHGADLGEYQTASEARQAAWQMFMSGEQEAMATIADMLTRAIETKEAGL